MPFLQVLLFQAITQKTTTRIMPDSSFDDQDSPQERRMPVCPILIPTWKPVFLLFTIKLLAVLSKEVGGDTAFKALACCEPPLLSKAIKLLFFFSPLPKTLSLHFIWHPVNRGWIPAILSLLWTCYPWKKVTFLSVKSTVAISFSNATWKSPNSWPLALP